MMTGRQRLLSLLEKRPVDHLAAMPITMMFAADQINARYGQYVRDYRVLVDAQVKTAYDFDFDHVSVISDPCREGYDLGAEVEWFDDQPPAFKEGKSLLTEKSALSRLEMPAPGNGPRMNDRVQAVAALKESCGAEKFVEGWVEGPCAQGANLRGINTLMLDFFDDPVFVEDLFEFVVELEVDFARSQVEAGADIIGIGDAAASLVGPRFYGKFVFPYQCRLIRGIRELGAAVRLHVCGRTARLLPEMTHTGADIVDLDWMVSLEEARRFAGPDLLLLGNIDPVEALRNSSPVDIEEAIAECHRQGGERYIVGAGCEIVRDTPAENVRAMVSYARLNI